jgi:hypothetical protein
MDTSQFASPGHVGHGPDALRPATLRGAGPLRAGLAGIADVSDGAVEARPRTAIPRPAEAGRPAHERSEEGRGTDPRSKTGKIAIGVGLGVYLFGVGMLTGVLIDRMRFDRQRSEVLGHYERALREWQTYRMALEKHAEAQRYPVRLKQADLLTNEAGRAAARPQADH